ncbi:hypothetical protein psal_cds_501 [Pandoravirus salinus]|uniref:Uncharacterized protein n=1 Tax=Pandoravirus salinus TaxID=1349410 RepID=S4W296_9VIRU|nr:hypothetical protein psal_cds_501 [Pandoravirus salinus]AGO84295.1 hypothetical protein psal_cds_501 [Pandoravirus salinus]
MARRCGCCALGPFASPAHRHAPKRPVAAADTFSALVAEAARWRQVALVVETPALLRRAREARETIALAWDHREEGADTVIPTADPLGLVISMAFGFAHGQPGDDRCP